jgi:hypothetical protein
MQHQTSSRMPSGTSPLQSQTSDGAYVDPGSSLLQSSRRSGLGSSLSASSTTHAYKTGGRNRGASPQISPGQKGHFAVGPSSMNPETNAGWGSLRESDASGRRSEFSEASSGNAQVCLESLSSASGDVDLKCAVLKPSKFITRYCAILCNKYKHFAQ